MDIWMERIIYYWCTKENSNVDEQALKIKNGYILKIRMYKCKIRDGTFLQFMI